jgi:hypothetical protein
MFAPYAQRFRIIAYLRDPYAYVASMFQQRLRRGETEASIVAGGGMRPNYRSIGHYRRAFGAANVDVRIFDPSRFPNGDLIADFMAAIEAPAELTHELEVVRANTALSHEASLLAGALNKLFPLGEDRRQNPERAAALMETLAEIPGQPYRCPAEVIAASRPLIETELAWLHKTLGRELFSAKPPSSQAAPLWDEKTLAAIALRLNELAKLKSVSGAQGENRSGWRALLRRLGFE